MILSGMILWLKKMVNFIRFNVKQLEVKIIQYLCEEQVALTEKFMIE